MLWVMEINKLIRERRLQLRLTQAELAARAGYKTPSTIARIESGENDIPQSKILSLAVALECTPSYLFGFTNDPEESAPPQLTTHESALLHAYRNQPEMQQAVDRLLGLPAADEDACAFLFPSIPSPLPDEEAASIRNNKPLSALSHSQKKK